MTKVDLNYTQIECLLCILEENRNHNKHEMDRWADLMDACVGEFEVSGQITYCSQKYREHRKKMNEANSLIRDLERILLNE